jgi:cell division protein FtsB
MMDDQHRQALEALQKELKATEATNETLKARIESLDSEIDSAIKSGHGPENLHGLRGTLEDSVDEFAAHHPTLAAAIRAAVNTLVNSGV